MLWGLNIGSNSERLQNRFTAGWGLKLLAGDTSEQVRWKLFGEELLSDEDFKSIHQSSQKQDLSLLQGRNTPQHTGSRVLLESLPKGFQQQLHASTPLSCHTSDEGLISNKYKRFLRTLIDYSSFHRSTGEMMGKARTLVWQCTLLEYCGGLVDRMKGITYALLLAMFSRRRLILYWGGPEHTYLRPNMIDWTDDVVYDYMGQYNVFTEYEGDAAIFDKKRPNLEEGGNDALPYEFRMFSILAPSGVDVSASELRYNLEIIGSRVKTVTLSTNLEPCTLLSTEKTAEQKWILDGLRWTGLASLSPQDVDNVVGIAFRYLFQMSPELILEVAHARSVLGLDSVPYTGVHIRTGFAGSPDSHEDINHPKLMRIESNWEDVLSCAISSADSFLGNSSLLFLATDSVLVKHLAVSKYGARIRTLDNRLIHLDKLEKQPGAQHQNQTEGILTSWVDFLLLAEAYSHVRGSSGYPWAAGLLCSIPNERLINGSSCMPESQHS